MIVKICKEFPIIHIMNKFMNICPIGAVAVLQALAKMISFCLFFEA